jgi:hypothetical protein
MFLIRVVHFKNAVLSKFVVTAVSAFRYIHLGRKCPDPVTANFHSYCDFGALTEQLEQLMSDFLKSRPCKMKSEFLEMMHIKSLQSHSHPGEPVGLLAAQVS